MAVAGSTDEAVLERGRTVRVGQQASTVEAGAVLPAAKVTSGGVVANHAEERHFGFQSGKQGGDAGGTAGSVMLLGFGKDGHRGLRADTLDGTDSIAVQHHVADDQDAWTLESRDDFGQRDRHGHSRQERPP